VRGARSAALGHPDDLQSRATRPQLGMNRARARQVPQIVLQIASRVRRGWRIDIDTAKRWELRDTSGSAE